MRKIGAKCRFCVNLWWGNNCRIQSYTEQLTGSRFMGFALLDHEGCKPKLRVVKLFCVGPWLQRTRACLWSRAIWLAYCARRSNARASRAGARGEVLPKGFLSFVGFSLGAINRQCITRKEVFARACARRVWSKPQKKGTRSRGILPRG